MLKKYLFGIVDIVTTVLAILIKIVRPLNRLLLRFGRLARLKSQCAFPVPSSTQLDGKVSVVGTGQLKLGEHCRIGNDVVFETQGTGKIILGNHVRINQGSHIIAYDTLTIGDDCLIGEYCSIRDANHGIAADQLIREQGHTHQPITIENDCWIARGVTLLKGATLRKGAIVGANAIVNYEVPARQIIVSQLGRYIKDRQ